MALKKAKSLSQDLVLILAVLGTVVAVNVLASWFFTRMDLTETKQYSISPATKNILRGLDDIINVKVFFSKNLPPQVKTLENDVRDLLSEYEAYGGANLRISWESPEDDEAKKEARELGVQEVQLNTYEKDKAAVIRAYMSIVVLYNDNKEVLELAQGMQNLEYDLTQAIMRVARSEEPKVAVLKTDTTPFIPQSVRRQMKMNQPDPTKAMYEPLFKNLDPNYQVDLVSTDDGQKSDPSYRSLIVPGGSTFTDRDLFEIDQYFMSGGNLIVLIDPVKVDFQYGVNGRANETKMLDLLEHYGVRPEKALVTDVVCGQVQIPQRVGMFQMNVAHDYPFFVAIAPDGFNTDNPAVAPLSGVIMPWVSPLKLLVETDGDDTASAGGVSAEVLVTSSPKSWLTKEPFSLSPTQKWEIPEEEFDTHTLMVHLSGSFSSYFQGKSVPPVGDADAGDTLSQIKLKPEDASREIAPSNTDAHLVVAGDADFASKPNATPGNAALMQNLVDWLTLDENLINIRTRTLVDRTLDPERLGKEGSAMPTIIRAINILLMPVLLIIVGLVIFFKRREPVMVTVTSGKPEEKKS